MSLQWRWVWRVTWSILTILSPNLFKNDGYEWGLLFFTITGYSVVLINPKSYDFYINIILIHLLWRKLPYDCISSVIQYIWLEYTFECGLWKYLNARLLQALCKIKINAVLKVWSAPVFCWMNWIRLHDIWSYGMN